MVTKKFPRVNIIILNWNGAEDTIECLNSIKKLTYPNFEVILIDNASQDNDLEKIKKHFSSAALYIQNNENYGFAAGNNIGIDISLKKNADYVLLLNNDTVVTPEFLDLLISVSESDEKIGLATPTILFYKTNKIQDQGHDISWYGPPKIFNTRKKCIKSVCDIEAALGTCLLIKRSVIEKIGLLFEDYFYQVEDTDYCVRARRAGYRIVCIKNAQIWHKGSSSLNKVPANKLGFFTRNRFIFRARYASFVQKVVFLLWFFSVEFPMNMIYYCLKFRDIKIVNGLIWGTRQGLLYLLRGQ